MGALQRARALARSLAARPGRWRRPPDAARAADRRAMAAIGAVCGIGAFVFVVTATSETAARRAEEPRRDRLVALIEERREQVRELDDAVTQLRRQAAAAETVAARRSAGDRALADRLRRVAELAGTVAMEGPGLEVRLSDSSRAVPDGDDAGAYRIHDRDLQLVVNALAAAGAEAIAVNDVRLVATSPIRAAGNTIVVSFRPVAPPYRVAAVGARRDAFEASEVSRLFSRWRELFGLGFRVEADERVQVPAYTGRVAVVSAEPE